MFARISDCCEIGPNRPYSSILTRLRWLHVHTMEGTDSGGLKRRFVLINRGCMPTLTMGSGSGTL
ncbi:hypothetical protein NST28_17425 [Paenibacillus sp. FSL R10-2791]|uniref:hypothetical protein n=1 Tax=Paenibacillus sp. FSL R10-2791 TaxID=2954695 RepID=UPI0030F9291B